MAHDTMSGIEMDMHIEVLVIGAGGCGLTAAIAAHEAGAEVAVIEKLERAAGNTVLSSGSIPGAGTRFQKAAGIDDTAERFKADLHRVAGDHDAPHLTAALAGLSGPLVEWLVDVAGVELTLVETYRHVGHSVARLHAPPSRSGADLLAGLERAAEARDIPLAFAQPAVRLLERDGRVIGAETRDSQGRTLRIGAKAVVLATNGFGGAPGLLHLNCPSTRAAQYAGAPGSEGEALRWGRDLGAATGNLGAFQGHAAIAARNGALVTWTVIERGGLIVDANGNRFADETLGYSAFTDHEMTAEGPCVMIYDARIAESVRAGQPTFGDVLAPGVTIVEETVAALARRAGLPADRLERTLSCCARAAEGGSDRFGRTSWEMGPLRAPLYATQIMPAVFHTQGGLMVDARARVLRPDGEAIPGLFAGGGAAVGISGRSGSGGYVSGNGLLSALGLGYVAGRAAGQAARGRTAPEATSRADAVPRAAREVSCVANGG
ncbi:FAD-dependent oxidoreductase [Stappia sp.]|uniref:FAD-dependent oxidoreductase n=1 Tax=Stappia sp. TaxID=1870903 RepID=UPI0032D961B2